jgi:hypothetical protein
MTIDVAVPPPVTNKVHFSKEILSNPVMVEGNGIAFEPIGGGRGLLALDPNDPGQAKIIAALNEFDKRGVGGVTKITATEYAEKKSLPPVTPLGRQRERLRVAIRGPGPKPNPPPTEATAVPPVSPPPAPPIGGETATLPIGAGAAAPDGPMVEKYEGFRPPTRRISRKPDADKKVSTLP